jgi:hypothetical protein
LSNLSRKIGRNKVKHSRAKTSSYLPKRGEKREYINGDDGGVADSLARKIAEAESKGAPTVSIPGIRMIGGSGSRYDHRAGESPADAHERGVGYAGPKMADKGKKDGSCNRTACQLPLKGERQWFMVDGSVVGSRNYYCHPCAMKFHEADRQFGDPLRCTEDTGA